MSFVINPLQLKQGSVEWVWSKNPALGTAWPQGLESTSRQTAVPGRDLRVSTSDQHETISFFHKAISFFHKQFPCSIEILPLFRFGFSLKLVISVCLSSLVYMSHPCVMFFFFLKQRKKMKKKWKKCRTGRIEVREEILSLSCESQNDGTVGLEGSQSHRMSWKGP